MEDGELEGRTAFSPAIVSPELVFSVYRYLQERLYLLPHRCYVIFPPQVVNNIRIFRIFRSLKTVTRIEKVRLLVSAIINAFTAMVFITILLGVFLYIFAIFGVIVFRGPTDELEDDESGTWNRFGNMWAAMATLFQIFTLDNWLNIAKQTEQTGGGWLTYFYVILWILIGSFIFNNIFVGIMVNNFQNIRNELFREVRGLENMRVRLLKHGW